MRTTIEGSLAPVASGAEAVSYTHLQEDSRYVELLGQNSLGKDPCGF